LKGKGIAEKLGYKKRGGKAKTKIYYTRGIRATGNCVVITDDTA